MGESRGRSRWSERRACRLVLLLEAVPGLIAGSLDATQAQRQLVRIGADAQRFVDVDRAVRHQLHERLVEALHAVLDDTLLDRLPDERRLVGVADVLADARR